MLKPHRPLRVAVLCSRRAPGLLYLLNRAPDRGVSYEIVCVVSSELTFDEEVRVERRGIPIRPHPIREFYAACGRSDPFDLEVRPAYDAVTTRLLEPYLPDIVLLDGYMYLVTAPLLDMFRARIINLHFSDLSVRRFDGSPRYPGIRAVRQALAEGCRETRATVHLVNELADDGAPILRSRPFPVSPMVDELFTQSAPEVFNAYAFAHQEWMLRTTSGPLIAAAMRLISTGAVDLDRFALVRGGDSSPWVLDEDGVLLAPELEPVEA